MFMMLLINKHNLLDKNPYNQREFKEVTLKRKRFFVVLIYYKRTLCQTNNVNRPVTKSKHTSEFDRM